MKVATMQGLERVGSQQNVSDGLVGVQPVTHAPGSLNFGSERQFGMVLD